jgi:hypothetical protein
VPLAPKNDEKAFDGLSPKILEDSKEDEAEFSPKVRENQRGNNLMELHQVPEEQPALRDLQMLQESERFDASMAEGSLSEAFPSSLSEREGISEMNMSHQPKESKRFGGGQIRLPYH